MTVEVKELLRAGLLDGVTLAVAAAPDPPARSVGEVVRGAATGLGAIVERVSLPAAPSAEDEEGLAEAAVAAALERSGSLQALIVDSASLFGAQGGQDALLGCMARVWNAVRATAGLAFIPAEAGGRIVLIAPAAGAEHTASAAAGLENLARTLSIEWARYRITSVALAPGADTSADELAALTCYLLSPAGAYFSGCLMDLRS